VRKRRARAILTTLLLSQGVPMVLGGDELWRTQGGNNNAYCQDNEISWYQWEGADEAMLAFTSELIRLRRLHPVLRRRRWFEGRSVRGSDHVDIGWYKPDGQEMNEDDWKRGYAKSLAVFLNGRGIPTPDTRGERVIDDSFLILFNAHHDPVRFVMPDGLAERHWEIVVYSATGLGVELPIEAPETGEVEGWSVVVLKQRNGVDR
jgi:glycogen operon protein